MSRIAAGISARQATTQFAGEPPVWFAVRLADVIESRPDFADLLGLPSKHA